MDDDIESIEHSVARLPAVARVDRAARSLSARVRRLVSDGPLWIRYEDARLLQRHVRQQSFYDAGFAVGRAIGVAEALERATTTTTAARSLRRRLRRLTLGGGLSANVIAAILVEIAQGLLVTAKGSRTATRTRAGGRGRRTGAGV